MSGFARILLTVFVLAGLVAFLGCGGGGESADTAANDTPAQTAQDTPAPPPSRQAIPDDAGMGQASPDVTLQPFFDEAGTVTELAVTPGENFKLYVCAQFPVGMANAAQFRLVAPDGVQLVKQTEVYGKTLTMGEWDRNFAMVFPCMEGVKRVHLMEFEFSTPADFSGGEIWTMRRCRHSPRMEDKVK